VDASFIVSPYFILATTGFYKNAIKSLSFFSLHGLIFVHIFFGCRWKMEQDDGQSYVVTLHNSGSQETLVNLHLLCSINHSVVEFLICMHVFFF
jgi:hypothetical protein